MNAIRTPGAYGFPLRLPKMHLKAYDAWKRAYARGLVSREEWERYDALIQAHPLSWKGWLKALGGKR